MGKLTNKQKMFVEEYLIDLNATQAAIRAGYSKNTAQEIGSENLSKPIIAEAVQQAMKERSERTQITADAVLQELAKLGFGNIQNVVNKDSGDLIPLHKMDEDVSATITEITVKTLGDGEDGVVMERKYKMADKKASLELLGKHLKLFTDKVEHSGVLPVTVIEPDYVD